MMSDLTVQMLNENEVKLSVIVCAQNPTLNPQQLISAIEGNLPACKPDFARIRREETLFPDGTVFR